MKKYLSSLLFVTALFIIAGINASAQDTGNGEKTFKQTCAACHTIGKGRLVGPDLANILQKKPEDWILNFVKSSQSVIKSGDKYADSLFQAYNQVVMPDHPNLNDDQIKSVIAYIDATSSGEVVTPQPSNQVVTKKTDSIFSTINIFLLSVILLMLIIILFLARANKNLLDQLRDYYSSNKSFF